jgi:hypothetical protein
MDEKELNEITKEVMRKIEQRLVVLVFFIGGLTILACTLFFLLGHLHPLSSTWRVDLLFGIVGTVMTIIGWRLKKKYNVSFS